MSISTSSIRYQLTRNRQNRYWAPADRVGSAVHWLIRPAWTWPIGARRSYVLLFPLAALLRLIVLIAVMVVWLVLGISGSVACYLDSIWHGEPLTYG